LVNYGQALRRAQCGVFGTPRGLGLATATTSAAFLPHLGHLIRIASAFSVILQPFASLRAQRATSLSNSEKLTYRDIELPFRDM
jgi:hypothetical protein